jgi:hypothetical protein
VPRADWLDGSGGAMAGSGLAAQARILAAMFALSDGLCAARFPIGLTVAVIRGKRAAGPARDHAKRPRPHRSRLWRVYVATNTDE